MDYNVKEIPVNEYDLKLFLYLLDRISKDAGVDDYVNSLQRKYEKLVNHIEFDILV